MSGGGHRHEAVLYKYRGSGLPEAWTPAFLNVWQIKQYVLHVDVRILRTRRKMCYNVIKLMFRQYVAWDSILESFLY